jgi:trk system potassium uptake protein TrkH
MGIGSKIAMKSTTHLLMLGTIAFFFIEWNNPEMLDRVWIGKIITALFSVVNRTAGFNAIDFSNLSVTALILFLILMFIGGASSSTSGGVKTSTMTLIYVAITSLVKRKKRFELFRRNISQELVLRAFIIFFFALGNIFIGSMVLSVTEAHRLIAGSIDFMDILFEVTSAFSSVGLSTGITSEMSEAGKIMLIINMYVGRIGTIMVLMAFAKKTLSTNYKYPDAHIMIG